MKRRFTLDRALPVAGQTHAGAIAKRVCGNVERRLSAAKRLLFTKLQEAENTMQDDMRENERRDEARRDTDMRDSAARDRAGGTMEKAGGRVKESFGALTGNERMEAEGRREQVSGDVRQKKGSLKDRVKAWIDRL